MSDELITVARFTLPTEAEVAAGRLRNAGIDAVVTGDLSATSFAGVSGMAQVEVRVRAHDAKMALDLLGELEAERAEPGWDEDLDTSEGVWVCTLCGNAVEQLRKVCPDCKTAREGVKASMPDLTRSPRPASHPTPLLPVAPDAVQKTGAVAPGPSARLGSELGEEIDLPAGETFLGDDLAFRAFRCSVVALFVPFLCVYTTWLLARLIVFPGELSPKASRSYDWAMLLNAPFLFLFLFLSWRMLTSLR